MERRIVEQRGRELAERVVAERVVAAPGPARDLVTDAVCRRWLDRFPALEERSWVRAILCSGLGEEVILPTLRDRLAAAPRVPELRWIYQVSVAVGVFSGHIVPGRIAYQEAGSSLSYFHWLRSAGPPAMSGGA